MDVSEEQRKILISIYGEEEIRKLDYKCFRIKNQISNQRLKMRYLDDIKQELLLEEKQKILVYNERIRLAKEHRKYKRESNDYFNLFLKKLKQQRYRNNYDYF